MFAYLNSVIHFWWSSLLLIAWLQQRSNNYVPEASLCLVFVYASFSIAPLWRQDGEQPLLSVFLLTCQWNGCVFDMDCLVSQFGSSLENTLQWKETSPFITQPFLLALMIFKLFFFNCGEKHFHSSEKGSFSLSVIVQVVGFLLASEIHYKSQSGKSSNMVPSLAAEFGYVAGT